MGDSGGTNDEANPYTETEFGRLNSQRSPNLANRMMTRVVSVLDSPVTWFREIIVLPNRTKTVYYHEKFRRAPTVDQCYTDDIACIYEAHEQFKRDSGLSDRERPEGAVYGLSLLPRNSRGWKMRSA